MISATQDDYWNRVAWYKEFTHPLDLELLAQYLSKDSKILDYGCGYGRTITKLEKAGYKSIIGVDTSAELIKRAKTFFDMGNVYHIESAKTIFQDSEFDCVILLAVLTCVPESKHQIDIVKEIRRLIKPGGYIFLSDYLLQSFDLNEGKYDADGVFVSSEGAFFRHHTMEYLKGLFDVFKWISIKSVAVKTLSGKNADAIQCFIQNKQDNDDN